MGDDDDDIVKRVIRGPQGNLRHDRIVDAVTGRRSSHPDLVPRLAVALVAALVLAPVIGYLDYGTVAGAVETLGGGLMLYAAVAFIWVSNRLENYYEGDDELAVEELRARYARGELTLAEFQQQVDRVYEEGPAFVFGDDDETDSAHEEGRAAPGDGGAATDEEPLDILQRRFARGELSEEDYRSRVAAIRETTDDAAASGSGTSADAGEREQEREHGPV